ncbi:MAG: DsbA family protein [Bifidobacteriaceae bacterium]|nr:DsbA family protein [Bifidobacteriaceae bacterium]
MSTKTSNLALWIAGGTVLAAAIFAAIWLTLPQATSPANNATTSQPTSTAATTPTTPPNPALPALEQVTVTDTLIQIGQADAPVTVDSYLEFMCPTCGYLERENEPLMRQMIIDGQLRVNFHLMNFLDPASEGTDYSTRAVNATVEIARRQGALAWDFIAALYEYQPDEFTPGLSDDDLTTIATNLGVSPEISSTFADLNEASWVTASNMAASDGLTALGATGTPTIVINGRKWEGEVSFADALSAAANG